MKRAGTPVSAFFVRAVVRLSAIRYPLTAPR